MILSRRRWLELAALSLAACAERGRSAAAALPPPPALPSVPPTATTEPDAGDGGVGEELALERRFETLRGALPRLVLGRFPTPVQPLVALGARIGVPELWLKRDDLAAVELGGSKVRKLELVLADARAKGAKSVVTFGGVGSNHALATALYGRQSGLSVALFLLAERRSPRVARMLRAMRSFDAEVLASAGRGPAEDVARFRRAHGGEQPYVIAEGGSSPLGDVGYVNAAFELAEQIGRGELPEPRSVVVAAGTAGSAAGLLLGLRAAGITARVIAVRTSSIPTRARVIALARAAAASLAHREKTFENVKLGGVEVEHHYIGRGYAQPTASGMRALRLARELGELELDSTYTAKAMAALIGRASGLEPGPVLFWNTFDPRVPSARAVHDDELPAALRGYL